MKKLEKTDSKQKILEATSELFLKGGLPALSVRAISKQSGLSTIGIYSYFQGKQGILDALYVDGFNMVYDAVNIDGSGLSPKQAVLKGCEGYQNVVEKYPAHYQLTFGKSETGYVPSNAAKAAGVRAFNRMNKLIATLHPEKTSIKKVRTTALDIWAIVHGYACLQDHAVSDLLGIKNWRERMLDAVANYVDAMD